MVDLGGYVIILVETQDKKVKLYGSPAEKADLEVADEILEVNGESLENSNHTDVIAHIHNCIKSRTICLRVKRRTSNKLAKELAENSHVQDAFVIAVEQQAKERLERLSALRRIKPVDMTKLSQQLCDTSSPDNDENNSQIYSAPVAELGSTTNLNQVASTSEATAQLNQEKNGNNNACQASEASSLAAKGGASAASAKMEVDGAATTEAAAANGSKSSGFGGQKAIKKGQISKDESAISAAASEGGYQTDEELELCHDIEPKDAKKSQKVLNSASKSENNKKVANSEEKRSSGASVLTSTALEAAAVASAATSPSKEVLIGGDNNPSRRSSRSSINLKNSTRTSPTTNGNGSLVKSMIDEETSVLPKTSSKVVDAKHQTLSHTLSLKSIVDSGEMVRCVDRLTVSPLCVKDDKCSVAGSLQTIVKLLENTQFQKLLDIHNIIQSVQCFQCPPAPLCCDAKILVRECSDALQSSPLTEAAELLDLLNHIEFEGLLFAHDKLAERQHSLPWSQCLAEMWTKERPSSATSLGGSASNLAASSTSLGGVAKAATPTTTTAATTPTPQATPAGGATVNNPSTSSPTANIATNSAGNSHNTNTSTDMTRVVKILKQNEPLGATVRNEGERVVIGRVVKGGAAERSGQLHPGDEVLEVNGLRLKGKSVHDICDRLCQMTGTLTFVIIPKATTNSTSSASLAASAAPAATPAAPGMPGSTPAVPACPASSASTGSIANNVPCGPSMASEACTNQVNNNGAQQLRKANSVEVGEQVYHYRAHFSYHPDDDLYIPCHELGISFQRGDILHVINRDDPHWWQAYRDGEWTQTLAGLIPSLSLQQHRMALQKQKREQDLKEQREAERNSPAKKKSSSATSLLCAKKSNKRKRHNSPFKKANTERFDIPPYEEMALYYPQANQKRPLILVGPPSIGRHELRLRLLEDKNRFAAAVPHTSRVKGEGEIDGQDYHFVARPLFEEYISAKRFVEHGEYDKQYYGTSLDAVRTVINSGKICVLNLQPLSLQILHESDLKPYVVFLTPPTLQTYRQQRAKYGDPCKEDEYRDSVAIAQDMEENYGHYFDSVIPFDDVDYVFQQLMYEINLLEREPQWVPARWVRQPSVSLN